MWLNEALNVLNVVRHAVLDVVAPAASAPPSRPPPAEAAGYPARARSIRAEHQCGAESAFLRLMLKLVSKM